MAEIQAPFGLNHTTTDAADTRTLKATLADRDAIPATSRHEGLFCYVISEQKTYQLRGGITNSNWVDISSDFDDLSKYFQARTNFMLGANYPYIGSSLTNGSFNAQNTVNDTVPIVSPLRLNGYGRVTLNIGAGAGAENVVIASYQAGSVNSNNLYAVNSEYLYGYSWIGLRQNWTLQNSVVTITGLINQGGWVFNGGFTTNSSGYYFRIFPNPADPNNTFRYQIVGTASAGIKVEKSPAGNTLLVGQAYLFEVIFYPSGANRRCEYRINGVTVGTVTPADNPDVINANSVLNHWAIGASRNPSSPPVSSVNTYVVDCGFAGFRQKYLTPIPFSNFYLGET
jgi:hypothetical protein